MAVAGGTAGARQHSIRERQVEEGVASWPPSTSAASLGNSSGLAPAGRCQRLGSMALGSARPPQRRRCTKTGCPAARRRLHGRAGGQAGRQAAGGWAGCVRWRHEPARRQFAGAAAAAFLRGTGAPATAVCCWNSNVLVPAAMTTFPGSTLCPGTTCRSSRPAMAAWHSGIPFMLRPGRATGSRAPIPQHVQRIPHLLRCRWPAHQRTSPPACQAARKERRRHQLADSGGEQAAAAAHLE